VILTAHQPVYLPWLGLFHKIAIADAFVSFNQVQYLPKDWNSRNRIKTAAGPQWLSVPVLRKGYLEKPISNIEINNVLPWRRKHWRSIVANYQAAPYFDDYAAFFEGVYAREWQHLAELNETMLAWFVQTLGIDTRILNAAEFDFQGRKSELVLDMCRRLDADVYVFGALGRDYAVVEDFEAAGVRAVFQEYQHPQYPQLHGHFVPYLSIIDLLFNCGPKSLDILMAGQSGVGT